MNMATNLHSRLGGSSETLQAIEIAELESRIRAHGFTVEYQDYCECAETPGFLGQIRGVTHRPTKRVRISRRANPTHADMVETLQHELRHIEEPDWDCGNRDMLGRGGPA